MARRFGFVALLVTVLAGALLADAGDPPSRVARLNYLNGAVSFRPGSVDDWGPATLNYPLTTGDHLWTDPGAQTEIHIGSTAVRMNSGTALSILNLDDRIVLHWWATGEFEEAFLHYGGYIASEVLATEMHRGRAEGLPGSDLGDDLWIGLKRAS